MIINKNIKLLLETRGNNFLFQDKQRNETDYFIYYDLDFFLILLLIEFAKKGKTSVTLWEFIGYGLQNISNKSPYILNYDTYIDYILKLLDNNFMYGDRFKFFQYEGITINSRYIYGSMMDNVAKIINEDIEPYEKVSDLDSVVGLTHNINKYAWHYGNIIQEYNDLEKKYKKGAHENKYNFSIGKDNYELGHIFELAPKNIYLNFSFNKDQVKNIEDNILSYLAEGNFGGDYPVSEQECILCFSKYKMKNDIIQIPFSILGNQDFDVIKTLKYMEYKGDLKIIDPLSIDKGFWEIKILNNRILDKFNNSINASLLRMEGIYMKYKGEEKRKLEGYQYKLCNYLFSNYMKGKDYFKWSELENVVYNQEKNTGQALKSLIGKLKDKAKEIGYDKKFITFSEGDYLMMKID